MHPHPTYDECFDDGFDTWAWKNESRASPVLVYMLDLDGCHGGDRLFWGVPVYKEPVTLFMHDHTPSQNR